MTIKPLTVQGDRTILADVHAEGFNIARDELSLFAELEKSPEHFHTYRLTPLSLWNAAAAGVGAERIIEFLETSSAYEIPPNVTIFIEDHIRRFGLLKLVRAEGSLRLVCTDQDLLDGIARNSTLKEYFNLKEGGEGWLSVVEHLRGDVKQALIGIGYPVEDVAGYTEGTAMPFELRQNRVFDGSDFSLRAYQKESADIFHAGGTDRGGSGVVVLPCGAGKTIVGIGCMERLQRQTLILTTNTIAVRQWRDELLDKTSLTPEQISEYTGEVKGISPVTISTYQMLTYRRSKEGAFEHFALFDALDWGLVIYDEVHLLPAPVFRVTAGIQARRRLGLTATLVREDGKEEEVFSLIGPKKYDVPWKILEREGWIATARCIEVRMPKDPETIMEYQIAGSRDQFRIASENPVKTEVVQTLISKHAEDRVLVIGQYIDQLESLAECIDCPLITGRTPNKERQVLYGQFREGTLKVLMVSKVGNFAVDLPDANVAIQISGTFGSRQEEAQRLGRILRPKTDGRQAIFYSLVTRDSREEDFASNRQLFLTEQGYSYEIQDISTIKGVDSQAKAQPGESTSHLDE